MDLEKLAKKSSIDGEIWVTEFTTEAALDFRKEILEACNGDPMRPVIVYINSYGGAVDALASMVETVEEVPNPIITVAHGVAMSCGAVLLSCGDVRFCGRHSRVMVHEASGGVQPGDVHDMHADAVEVKRLNRWFMGLLAKNCGIPGGYEAIRKMIKGQDGREKYMDATEAVKFGIVDLVGMPKLSRMKLYQVDVVAEKKRPAKNKPSRSRKGITRSR